MFSATDGCHFMIRWCSGSNVKYFVSFQVCYKQSSDHIMKWERPMTCPIRAPSPRSIPLCATFVRHESIVVSLSEYKRKGMGSKTHDSKKPCAQKWSSKWPETLQFALIHYVMCLDWKIVCKTLETNPTEINDCINPFEYTIFGKNFPCVHSEEMFILSNRRFASRRLR